MTDGPSLHWLPEAADFRARLSALRQAGDWGEAVRLAGSQLDFTRTNALDAAIRQAFPAPGDGATRSMRLAVLGSSTLAHLHAGIRMAALRRGLWLDTYENEYGQYLQELLEPHSGLHAFAPEAVLFAFDAHHVTAGLHAGMDAAQADAVLDEAVARIEQCWRQAAAAYRCVILQQAVLDVFPALMGGNEQRLPGSRSRMVARLNERLRVLADAASVDIVAVDGWARRTGDAAWHDPALWHRSKQEVAPTAAPLYGELVARIIAARQGRSSKCLVLDLDNTIWGGVIGDDGLDGIVLGQGSALGEGFTVVQEYARDLSRRGVILAVCSKNDEANALEAFEKHPEMVLRRADIASFKANWADKASNIRAIAQELNIGLDALVFLDDNPFERALVRQELPMVAVPEVPDDPALVPHILAAAGYFEAVAVTAEDRERTAQYQDNRARETLRASVTDLDGYLRDLEMRLLWRRFDSVGLQRTVQLINKTNQFNLTTRRVTEEQVLAIMADANAFGLQLRLLDRFGDNGVIAIVIGRRRAEELVIDTWLMSCRVLGRKVEQATLDLVAREARRLGCARLVGTYVPTAKNGMVRDHYARLGFTVMTVDEDGGSVATLDLDDFSGAPTPITMAEG